MLHQQVFGSHIQITALLEIMPVVLTDMASGMIFKTMPWALLLTETFVQGIQELENLEIIQLTPVEGMV